MDDTNSCSDTILPAGPLPPPPPPPPLPAMACPVELGDCLIAWELASEEKQSTWALLGWTHVLSPSSTPTARLRPWSSTAWPAQLGQACAGWSQVLQPYMFVHLNWMSSAQTRTCLWERQETNKVTSTTTR
jgi:hypothetical protein